jgi:hypothetical protein
MLTLGTLMLAAVNYAAIICCPICTASTGTASIAAVQVIPLLVVKVLCVVFRQDPLSIHIDATTGHIDVSH